VLARNLICSGALENLLFEQDAKPWLAGVQQHGDRAASRNILLQAEIRQCDQLPAHKLLA
jgi:hypothetical protein